MENNYEDFTFYIDKDLAGSKTEKNLNEAFCGESMARNKYTYFSEKAREEGYVQIARIFEETAHNEKEHAKIWYKILSGGKIHNSLDNLHIAANGEQYEWEDMYRKFAQDAREEGYEKIAALFETIRTIEKMHMTRYKKLIEDVQNNQVFEKSEKTFWECANCGYTYESEKALEVCPFCKHPKAFFFEKCFNY